MEISSYKYEILRRALRELMGKSSVEISADEFRDEPLNFKVNWAAMGRKSPAEARKVARAIDEASALAEYLNDLDIMVNWSKDADKKMTEAGLRNDTDVCKHLLFFREYYDVMIEDWFEDLCGELWYDKGTLKRVQSSSNCHEELSDEITS